LRRLANRFGEEGTLATRSLSPDDKLADWCETFLALEASGWKGARGAALGNDASTRAFFHDAMAGARAAGKLDMVRMDLDGNAVAMMVNFMTPPGSWSFKIAHDEVWARYSPGVLIELENLRHILAHPDIAWMDSCAVEDHPMINSLWRERRTIIQVSVPLAGKRRQIIYKACRMAEAASANWRRLRQKNANEDDD
jgi:hypothetical protein